MTAAPVGTPLWCREHGLPTSDVALQDEIDVVSREVRRQQGRCEHARAQLRADSEHLRRLVAESQRRGLALP